MSRQVAGQSRAASRRSDASPPSAIATLGSNIWVAAITGVVGLVGALIGGGFTLAGTLESSEAEAATQERDLRRVAYVEYIDALDAYASAAASRRETCAPGTDKRLASNSPCWPLLAEYENTMYVFQGERNDMALIASDEALKLAYVIKTSLPSSGLGPIEGTVDDEPLPQEFELLYQVFLAIAACDTSPNPREDCPDVRAYVRSEAGLAKLADVTRQEPDRSPEASKAPN